MRKFELLYDRQSKVIDANAVSDIIYKRVLVASDTDSIDLTTAANKGSTYALITPTRGLIVICGRSTITADNSSAMSSGNGIVNQEFEIEIPRLINVSLWNTLYVKCIQDGNIQIELYQ